MSFVVGSPVTEGATFKDATGALVDPSAVTFYVTLPDASTANYAATKVSTGVYQYTYTPTQTGRHQFYFIGTGPNGGTLFPDIFTVHGLTTSAIVSLAEVKAQLNKSATYTADDSELMGYIEAATFAVNHLAGYTVSTVQSDVSSIGAPEPTSGYIPIKVNKTPVLSVTSITPTFLSASPVSLTGMFLDSEAGIIWLPTTAQFLGPCTVVYTAGRSTIPSVLASAALMIVKHLWDTQRGGATAIPGQGGDESVTVPGVGFGLPVRAVQMLEMSPYHAAPGFA